MKTPTILFSLSCCILLTFGCTKEADIIEKTPTAKSIEGRSNDLCYVTNGRLVFDNEESILRFAEIFSNESDSSLNEFESKMGYTSYKTTKGEDFYSDENPLQSSLLATIINQNGIHQVGDTAIKVHFIDDEYKLYLLSGVTEERIIELNNIELSDYIYEISNEDIFRDMEKSGCGGCVVPAISKGKVEFEYDGVNPNNPSQKSRFRFFGRAHFDNIGSIKHVYHLTKHKRVNATSLTPAHMANTASQANFKYKKNGNCNDYAGSIYPVELAGSPILRNNLFINTRCARYSNVIGSFQYYYTPFGGTQLFGSKSYSFN